MPRVAAGRNAERTALLLRDLLADYPERSGLARELTRRRTARRVRGRGALESSIDACEQVAHVLEGMSLKRRRR